MKERGGRRLSNTKGGDQSSGIIGKGSHKLGAIKGEGGQRAKLRERVEDDAKGALGPAGGGRCD